MALPDLAFTIRGRDQSGAAFGAARRHIGDTRRAARALNSDIKMASASVMGLGKSALIGATGMASFAMAIAKMKDGLADFDRTAKVARQNGLDGEFYQTLAFMAGEASVEVSVLEAAMRKFSIGVGEAREGTGSLYTSLKRVNPELLTALMNSETAADRLRLYSDAVAKASTADERAALVKAAFGARGADLVRVLELGSRAMDDAGDRARELGNIIEDDILDQAEEMQNRLGNAADALDKQLNAALVSASPLMVNFYENMAAVVKATRDWSGELDKIPDALAKIGSSPGIRSFQEWMESKGLINPDAWWGGGGRIKKIEKGPLKTAPGTTEQTPAFTTGYTFGGGGLVTPLPRSKPAGGWVDPANRKSADRARLSASNRATRDLERQEEAYKRVVERLNRETAALTMNSVEMRIANEQARAGVEASSERGKAIAGVVTELERQRAAQDAYNEQLQFFGQIGGGAFSDLISGAEDFAGVMRRVGLSIADAALQAAIFGQGPLASLFGVQASGGSAFGGLLGLFDGFFADGGAIGPGRWGIAGEAGPEIVTGPAKVWTPEQVAAVSGGRAGGGGSVHAPVYNVDARGAQQGVAEQIVAAIEEYDRRVAPRTARSAVGRANRLSTSSDFRR